MFVIINGCENREPDRLGGHDPYSASKAGAEFAIGSWYLSFFGCGSDQTPHLRIVPLVLAV